MKVIITGWAKRKFVFPLIKALKAGLSIERLAVSLALGITVGIIPLYGFTTVLVGCIALSLKLDFVTMQVAHYIVQPIQLALLVPFFKLGDACLKSQEFSYTVKQYIYQFKIDFWGTLHDVWLVNLSAVVIWMLVAIPLFILLYYTLRYLFSKHLLRFKHVSA